MKNRYEIRGNVTAIIINSPKYGKLEALISTKKLKMVELFPNTWGVSWSEFSKTFYVVGKCKTEEGKIKNFGLHRWITGDQKGLEVDHYNHNGLDNTDKNLRVVTRAENQQNKRGANKLSTSGARGVYWNKQMKKWSVGFKINGKTKSFGHYSDFEEAKQTAIEARMVFMPFSREA